MYIIPKDYIITLQKHKTKENINQELKSKNTDETRNCLLKKQIIMI